MKNCESLKYKYFIILFVFINIFIGKLSSRETVDDLCGPQSLLTICNKFGISATLNELCVLAGFQKQFGTTMLGLYQASIKKNLPVLPLRININQLCSYKSPSIVFVSGNHFLVVHECKRNNIIIQNPPEKPVKISKEDFQKRWDGEALVFSKKLKKQMSPQIEKVTSPPEEPLISFHETEYNFGVVNTGDLLTYKFTFSNIGKDTLTVSTRSTCSCTAVVLSDKNIPPGNLGEIIVEFDTTGKKGYTTQSVDVRTNNPEKRWVRLTMQATIRSSTKVVPDRLWLDEITIGEELKREILVIDPGDSTLKVERVKTPVDITADILPMISDSTKRFVPVKLTIDSGIKPGKFEKQVIIHTNDPNRKEITVPISGVVIGELKVFPPVIFFGEVNQETKVFREIDIYPTKNERLEIVKAVSSSQYISTEVKPNVDDSKFTLVVTLQASKNAITIRDNIPIYINGNSEPAIEIPLYASVAGE